MGIKAPADYVPRGDMGLGLCYQGMRILAKREVERQQAPDQAAAAALPGGFVPNFAVCLAPYPVPELGGQALALPCCFGCLSGSADQCGGPPERQGSGLLVARNGFGGVR